MKFWIHFHLSLTLLQVDDLQVNWINAICSTSKGVWDVSFGSTYWRNCTLYRLLHCINEVICMLIKFSVSFYTNLCLLGCLLWNFGLGTSFIIVALTVAITGVRFDYKSEVDLVTKKKFLICHKGVTEVRNLFWVNGLLGRLSSIMEVIVIFPITSL